MKVFGIFGGCANDLKSWHYIWIFWSIWTGIGVILGHFGLRNSSWIYCGFGLSVCLNVFCPRDVYQWISCASTILFERKVCFLNLLWRTSWNLFKQNRKYKSMKFDESCIEFPLRNTTMTIMILISGKKRLPVYFIDW